jgi:hypothetical protein
MMMPWGLRIAQVIPKKELLKYTGCKFCYHQTLYFLNIANQGIYKPLHFNSFSICLNR